MARNGEATVTLSLIDRITGPIKRISSRLAMLGKRIGIERIGVAVNRLGTAFRGLGEGLLSTATRLASLATIVTAATTAAVAGAYNLAKSTADLASEINDTAFKLGIGVEALQEFRYAAGLSSIEAGTFDKGVEKLGINAVAAAKGNKEMAKSFAALGVKVKGAKGQMRPTEAILNDTLVALTKIEDPIKRNALAFKIFGKSGVELTKMLGDGAEGLAAARKEARELGFVMDQSAASLGDKFGDDVDKLLLRLQGFKNFLGMQLIPVIDELVLSASAWLKENSKLIRSTIVEWVKRFATFLRDLMNPASEIRQQIKQLYDTVMELGRGFASFLEAIKPVVDYLGGPMKSALLLIGLWALAPTIAAVTSLAFAFGGLGLAIGKVGLSLAGLGLSKLAPLFAGMATEAGVAGTAAGTAWGAAFGVAAMVAVAAAVGAATMYILQQIDPAGNLGGLTKPVDDWLRKKLDLPAKDSGITPGEIYDGLFGSKKKDSPGVPPMKAPTAVEGLNSFYGDTLSEKAITDRIARKKAFFQNGAVTPGAANTNGTNDNASPSSITTGNINASSLSLPDPLIAHEPQTVNAPYTVNLTINAPGADPNAIAGAVKSALAAQGQKQAAAVKSSLSD